MAVVGEIEDESEEDLIRYYFLRGFQYGEIKDFLSEYHEKEMSISTLKRRIKSYGLSRRNPDYDEQMVRDAIRDMIDGPACLWGYRSVWHGLQLQGLRVPRTLVQQLLKEIDPHGSSVRKAHRLKRRTYRKCLLLNCHCTCLHNFLSQNNYGACLWLCLLYLVLLCKGLQISFLL